MEDQLGYEEVQIKGPLELGPLFQGVASNDLQAFQDVWLPNHEDYLSNPQIENDVELLKPWYEGKTAYGIAVPDYMDVHKSIADLDQAGTDEITGIEPSAAFHPVIKNKVIPGYNLDMKLVESSTAAMLSELDKKYSAKEPIVFLGWSPHWMNSKYDFHYLDDPKNLQGAFDDPSRITTVVNEDLADDDARPTPSSRRSRSTRAGQPDRGGDQRGRDGQPREGRPQLAQGQPGRKALGEGRQERVVARCAGRGASPKRPYPHTKA